VAGSRTVSPRGAPQRTTPEKALALTIHRVTERYRLPPGRTLTDCAKEAAGPDLRTGGEMTTNIEKIQEWPVDGLEALAEDSEQAGWRFVGRLADEWAAGSNRFGQPGEALFAARVAGVLVGVCGLNADPYAANPRVGRVRRLYVHSAHRRQGI